MISQDSKETYEAVKKSLQDLKMFYYNIGFAGEQSGGKSTVINSLIRYPLMSTCNLTTTCASTKLIYGNKVRITVNDDDTKKRILDIDCANLGRVHIQKLKEYACAVTQVAVIENIQYFTPKDIFNESPIKVEDLLYFDEKDPKHIAVFMMILLTVYAVSYTHLPAAFSALRYKGTPGEYLQRCPPELPSRSVRRFSDFPDHSLVLFLPAFLLLLNLIS